jgi:hypothetical protein
MTFQMGVMIATLTLCHCHWEASLLRNLSDLIEAEFELTHSERERAKERERGMSEKERGIAELNAPSKHRGCSKVSCSSCFLCSVLGGQEGTPLSLTL